MRNSGSRGSNMRERGGGANKLGRRATEKGSRGACDPASGSSSGSGTQTSTTVADT